MNEISGFVETEQATLFYRQCGKGPDIVWIPAGDQDGSVYHEQVEVLASQFRCTCIDPRGAGQSVSKIDPPWSIEVLAGDCAQLIRQVCDPPVIVTGLSYGALMVQELAITFPELIKVAIPMGTTSNKDGFMYQWEQAEIEFYESGGRLSNAFATAHYAVLGYPAEVLGDNALWQKLRSNIDVSYNDRDSEMLVAQWRACLEYDSSKRLPLCQVPMHVIAFDQDLQTPPSRGKRVSELAGNGHFHLLKGMGHFSIFGHKPHMLTQCLLDILKDYR